MSHCHVIRKTAKELPIECPPFESYETANFAPAESVLDPCAAIDLGYFHAHFVSIILNFGTLGRCDELESTRIGFHHATNDVNLF